PLLSYFLFFSRYRAHRDPHSFPTRRSSDLGRDRLEPLGQLNRVAHHDDGERPASVQPLRREQDHLVPRDGVVALPRSAAPVGIGDRKSTRLNSSHVAISYAVFCLKKKKEYN